MTDERLDDLLEIEQTRLPIHQRHHVDAENGLHLGVLIQVVQHDLGHLAAPQLDDHAHAVLVRLVAQLGDALELALLHQFRDSLEQTGFVDLIGQL